MNDGRKPSAWKFQRRDSFNGPIYWSVSMTDPTRHPYRHGGPVIPLYESEVAPERAELTLAAFDALERESARQILDAKTEIRRKAKDAI